MKTLKQTIKEQLMIPNTQRIDEMARIRQTKSGLSMLVWLSPKKDNNTGQHKTARLKFQDNTDTNLNPSNLVPISIDAVNPEILIKGYKTKLSSKMISELKRWIIVNYSILIKYWNDEIYEDDLIDGLKSI